MVVNDEDGATTFEDIIKLDKSSDTLSGIGLSLEDSKDLLKSLQNNIVNYQAQVYTHTNCPHCEKKRRIKGNHTIQYRTLFGIVTIPSRRVYRCECEDENSKTVSILTDWLTEHNAPELQYIETKWASLMSYCMTADLLKDILPIGDALNSSTIRNHLHKVAKRQEKELEEKSSTLSGSPHDWEKLAKPGKPITVGIDGGYVKNWREKNTNFEIIVGKSFSEDLSTKRFGMVQVLEDEPKKRLLNVLVEQGMQANQQVSFLSDGADNVRNLQYDMYPESSHILDWFHVTMRLTVLNQFAKGMVVSDPEFGAIVQKDLESAKWYLWHGNVKEALGHLNDCCALSYGDDIQYEKSKRFYRHLTEMYTYINNNTAMIPNYGELLRYGETISTSFVESSVNEVIAKRMVKKQQMQWTHEGAHYLLQTRTAVLNDDLQKLFDRWYSDSNVVTPPMEIETPELKLAA